MSLTIAQIMELYDEAWRADRERKSNSWWRSQVPLNVDVNLNEQEVQDVDFSDDTEAEG